MTVHPRQATPALLQADAILGRLSGSEALSELCRFLRGELGGYSWVGVYRSDGTELSLVAYDGDRPTEHTRIPIGTGICGLAAREGRTVVVPDVRARSDYLACFPETRAEIVVPIRDGDRVIGEIDVDGTTVGAFDASDSRFLETLAGRLGAAVRASEPVGSD